jgi:hypothetical protein
LFPRKKLKITIKQYNSHNTQQGLSANNKKLPSFALTITQIKVTFVTAVIVKQQRMLLQQGTKQYGDN